MLAGTWILRSHFLVEALSNQHDIGWSKLNSEIRNSETYGVLKKLKSKFKNPSYNLCIATLLDTMLVTESCASDIKHLDGFVILYKVIQPTHLL